MEENEEVPSVILSLIICGLVIVSSYIQDLGVYMKLAVCIKYINNSAKISGSLGKSDNFYIYDTINNRLVDKFTNHFKSSLAAEIFCAQTLIKRGVNAVICGKCESDAKKLFLEAKIRIIENNELHPAEVVNIINTRIKKNSGVKFEWENILTDISTKY